MQRVWESFFPHWITVCVSVRSNSIVFYCEMCRISLICLIIAAKSWLTSALCVAWCLLLVEAGRAWGLGEALWDENWSGLFLFPLFYLSCHYVSSAVFNDGSSLQAVSGCTAVGGGDQWILAMCVFFLNGIVFEGPETSLADATNTMHLK